MADRVNASMQGMQSTRFYATPDASRAYTGRQQLLP
jgi:hypothetical protein